MTYEHLKLRNFEKTLHEPFMAASISGHLSLQCPWVPQIRFALPEPLLVKIEPLYALVFRMQAGMNLCPRHSRGTHLLLNMVDRASANKLPP